MVASAPAEGSVVMPRMVWGGQCNRGRFRTVWAGGTIASVSPDCPGFTLNTNAGWSQVVVAPTCSFVWSEIGAGRVWRPRGRPRHRQRHHPGLPAPPNHRASRTKFAGRLRNALIAGFLRSSERPGSKAPRLLDVRVARTRRIVLLRDLGWRRVPSINPDRYFGSLASTRASAKALPIGAMILAAPR